MKQATTPQTMGRQPTCSGPPTVRKRTPTPHPAIHHLMQQTPTASEAEEANKGQETQCGPRREVQLPTTVEVDSQVEGDTKQSRGRKSNRRGNNQTSRCLQQKQQREDSRLPQTQFNHEQRKIGEKQRPRKLTNQRKIPENNTSAPRVAAATKINSSEQTNQAAGTRILLQRPEMRRNRNDWTETAEPGNDTGRNDRMSRPRRSYSFDKAIAKHCRCLAQADLSLTPKIKRLSFINWPFPADGIYRRQCKSPQPTHLLKADSSPLLTMQNQPRSSLSICTYPFPSDGVYRRNRATPQQANLHRAFFQATQCLQNPRLEPQTSKEEHKA